MLLNATSSTSGVNSTLCFCLCDLLNFVYDQACFHDVCSDGSTSTLAAVAIDCGPLTEDQEDDCAAKVPSQPSACFITQTWWDALLAIYAEQELDTPQGVLALTDARRATAFKSVILDVRAMFLESVFWTSFLHIPRLFDTLQDNRRRQSIQPSLLLSILSVGVLTQSSEVKLGAKGRERALKLNELTHSAFQASLLSNRVDVGLLYAAWVCLHSRSSTHPVD